MISEILHMNGYGLYVWSSFLFTLFSFGALYIIVKAQLMNERKRFEAKFKKLEVQKTESARKQKTYREILINTSTSNI